MGEILGDVASNQKGRMEVSHARPGIMLLTSSRQLLYKNRWASDLCLQNHSIPGRENGKRGASASRRESRRRNL